jgi:KDO2-lipid IV(A) lauroyltransferase
VYFVACGLVIAGWALPERLASALGAAVGWVIYLVLYGRRRIGRQNLELAFPEKTQAERDKILRRCFQRLGTTIVEVTRLFTLDDDEVRRRVRYADDGSLERYEEAIAKGKGLVFVTGHIGNWEMLAVAHALHGHPASIVVRTLDNVDLERHISKMRSRGGNTVTPRKSGLTNIRELIRTLRRGGAVALLVDQAIGRRHGVLVPFFGRQAWSSPAPARLAIKTGAAVLPVFIERDEDNPRQHVIRIWPNIELEPSGNKEEDVRAFTEKIQCALEERIRQRPEDWFWVHRRWKRSPEAPEIY